MALSAVGLKTHIYNNNLRSFMLLAGFPLLIFAMVFAYYAIMFHINGVTPTLLGYRPDADIDWLDGTMAATLKAAPFIFSGVAIWFVIAYFFHSKMTAAAAGSLPVTRKEYPKIYNMLENLCISRGIPMPDFRIIDTPALNAFASGINDKTYTITLTRGIIEALEDDELEAVIAHELSHIRHGDVRLLIISVIFVGIISFAAEFVFRMLIHGRRTSRGYGRRSSNNKGGGNGLILIVGLVILVVGYIFAILIRFAMSRRREYMADAGAVELTKNPSAMMRALMRISGRDVIKDMPDDLQQMCIENSVGFMGVFATHPKIEDRVKTISEMTSTPVPTLSVSLKRPPKRPWDHQ